MRALGYCAEQLAAGKVFPLKPDADGIAFKDEELHLKHWFPILTALAHVVSHKHIDVRTAYVQSLSSCTLQGFCDSLLPRSLILSHSRVDV